MLQTTALDILKMGRNVFLTGAPGTGKTYVLRSYVRYLRDHGVFPVLSSPTGIAASHIGGMTIHSCFGLGHVEEVPSPSYLKRALGKPLVRRRLSGMQVLIVDEVSMLSPVLFETMDLMLRLAKEKDVPFGDVQVVFSGDFFQLAPVSRTREEIRYAWQTPLWEALGFHTCYLHEVYRQRDGELLTLLEEIRCGNVSEGSMDALRRRYRRLPKVLVEPTKLYTHNADIDRINAERLEALDGRSATFLMKEQGPPDKTKKILSSSLLSPALQLKVGAAVMFIKNSPQGEFINGTMGTVLDFDEEDGYPLVETEGGLIHATPLEWLMEDEEGKTEAKVTQVPLRLAWAITVHKSQGMTLDAAEIDLSKTFEPGQGYVALSRLKTMDGLMLMGMNQVALLVDEVVSSYDAQMRRLSEYIEGRFSEADVLDVQVTQRSFLLAAGGEK
ncbi:helicase [Candidatus Gracilibacteria bacterium CG17_big_fil_post_rev_8_21_14_2_50_48_13]|nr:MAG: helicase [Candidatus Gracilibacteria bacterium CG17_big_fil_post_rev_8_21_14_2_50_48_13]